MEKARLIITGGTFDKHYDEIRGELSFKDSHLPEILPIIRCQVPVELEINQLVDSLDMKEENRKSIVESCRRSQEDRILIIHGTDTMTETALELGKENLPKTIVLTGAMVPYSVQRSDALFNLGTALGCLGLLKPGVYIAMNGLVFPWNKVMKNKSMGIFVGESLSY